MRKIVLVDGNNLLFRSYYATAYTGNFMKNSKGFPTNALYGFTNMMNKILKEENPTHIIVAFDKGKTFRHEKYDFYKDGRSATPDELKLQFPLAKDILDGMGIKHYEIDNYEADDIIGTFAKFCDIYDDIEGLIISSDRDLLQLISESVSIKLLKSKDHIRYNKDSFIAEYGINPINVIDLKSLMGDASDNIPGVKGIGEKGALKLLHEYGTLENLYNNIDSIKGKLKEKLVDDRDNAFMSYEIATIYKDVVMEISLEDTIYLGRNTKLNDLFNELEFFSMIKDGNLIDLKVDDIKFEVLSDVKEIKMLENSSIYFEFDGFNYHKSKVIGIGVYNSKQAYFFDASLLKEFDLTNVVYTYDLKKCYVACKYLGINISDILIDVMIAGYLLEYNIKDDIAYLANALSYNLPFNEEIYGKYVDLKLDDISKNVIARCKFIYDINNDLLKELESKNMTSLFYDIEMPLCKVLGDMEYAGVNVNVDILQSMGDELKSKLDVLTLKIHNLAGVSFNIASPSQLGDILFEKLGLPHGKKLKSGYSTAVEVLNKIKDSHEIVPYILEYRTLSKLYSTYVEGLIKMIFDGKIHTIYTQTLTRTGRLSSVEPNLQNIPIRIEEGKLIRKAFVADDDCYLVSFDYSQIELRILAHVASESTLIESFNNDIDIHSKTASLIMNKDILSITKDDRRIAKAVNFGIIYGISSYGLAENLGIKPYEAKEFIDNYLNTYPGIRNYMYSSINSAYETGYGITMFNRRRNIAEIFSSNKNIKQSGERMALNMPIQGASADIIKMAMINVSKKFNELGLKSKMLLQVHDELVFNVLKTEFEIVKEIITDCMENTVDLQVKLKIDCEYGVDWYSAK